MESSSRVRAGIVGDRGRKRGVKVTRRGGKGTFLKIAEKGEKGVYVPEFCRVPGEIRETVSPDLLYLGNIQERHSFPLEFPPFLSLSVGLPRGGLAR
jgi:hypothetical protein